jgi:hypothetical protein
MNNLIDPRAYRLFDANPERDVEGSKVRLRKMICENDALLDFSGVLKSRGWVKNIIPAVRMLNDIYTHQNLWKEGNNEWVAIGGETGWSTSCSNAKKREIKDQLMTSGCIESDGFKLYGPCGSKAFCYRFKIDFHNEVVMRVANQKPVLKKWLKKACRLKQGDFVLDQEFKRQLEANIKALEINWIGVEQIYDQCQHNAALVRQLLQSLRSFLDQNLQAYQQRNRIFTPVVNLPSQLRHLVSHKDGKELVKVDIKSCHATFISSRYEAETKEERKEAGVYRNLIKWGFYEVMRQQVYIGVRPRGRDEVKRLFNAFLNSREWGNEKIRISYFNAVGKAFIKKFPILFQRIKDFVRKHGDEIMSRKGYPSIGIALMAIELKVLYPVYNELIARGYWFVPMHDGFVVEQDGLALAVQLTEQSLLERIGAGSVTVEDWIPSILSKVA